VANPAERRQHGRVGLSEHVHGSMGLGSDFRVVNLSTAGAMVEHTAWLAVGQPCEFALRLPGADLALRAYVVWSQLHALLPGLSDEEAFRFHSGLQFAGLAADADARLRAYLATLRPPRAAPPHRPG